MKTANNSIDAINKLKQNCKSTGKFEKKIVGK
jgi:hypothetical protein